MKASKIRLVALVASMAISASPAVVTYAQVQASIPRVAILAPMSPGSSANGDAFRQGLNALGYVEGRNIVFEVRRGNVDEFPRLAAEVVQLKVDVIVAGGGPASLSAAREATKTTPIVMVGALRDPVGERIVETFARPGGNVTGIVSAPDEITGKQLGLLKEALPRVSTVGVLWDASVGQFRLSQATRQAAGSLGIDLKPFEVRDPGQFSDVITAASRAGIGAMLLPGSPTFVQNWATITGLLTRQRLAAISIWRSFADAGGLMAYGPSLPDEFRRAASFVDKILKGAKPGDLPVEQPTKFELVINLKTAKALGLTIPHSLLLRADEVVQ